MKNVLLIINPISGRQTIEKKIDGILDIFKKNNIDVHTEQTKFRGHATQMAKAAFENGYDTLICCGGDGTLNEVFTGLLESGHNKEIKLGYLPCGSTNDFADTLGLNIDPIVQTRNILNEKIMPMDVGKFGDDKFFSYISCFGAFSDSSYSAPQKLKNHVGHFAYILEGLKDFWHIKPTEGRIIVDGEEFSGKFAFGSVSNTKSVAGIVKLKDDIVNLEDGLFEVILVRYPKNIFNLLKIVFMAKTSNFSSDDFILRRAKKIECEFNRDIPWSLDGEKAEPGKSVVIENYSKAIDLLK